MTDQDSLNNKVDNDFLSLVGISAAVGRVFSNSFTGAGVGVAAVLLGKNLQETWSNSEGNNYVFLELGAGLIGGAR
jgi:hypothetical protein